MFTNEMRKTERVRDFDENEGNHRRHCVQVFILKGYDEWNIGPSN